MNTEQRLKRLEEQVALSSVASFNHGHASVSDLDALTKRLQAVEAVDINPKLVALRNSIKDDLSKQLNTSQRALVSNLLDVILQEDRGAMKALREELEATAGQATKAANDAAAISKIEIDSAISLLSSKSYVFGHGE
jgi:hypothetical protein